MNNKRRESITKLIGQIDDLKSQIETLTEEEQDAYDNMPESLQGGDKGDAAQTAIDALESAVGSLEEAVGSLEEATA
jgi:polyhydroxyalkanoate synthesis regulator phasin